MTFVGSGWGLRKKEVDAMGHTVESESKAQLGLGITMPYISPPLIRVRLSGTNQGTQEAIAVREVQRVDIGRLRNSLMCPQKARYICRLGQSLSLSDGS